MMDTRILEVFREVFDDDELVVQDDTTAKTIPGWDSLAQVKLIIGLEEAFQVKFTTNEVATMTCVGDLRKTLHSKDVSVS